MLYNCFLQSFRPTYVVSVILTALGIGPVDEDVDIGGSEAPVTSYPPVHIDRDTGGRAEECNEAG